MATLKKLFKQTFIYGLATVLPRLLNFILVPLYTSDGVLSSVAEYGKLNIIFSYFIFFNVILAYGMETAFFRFFHKEKNKNTVTSTASISLLISSLLFLIIGFLLQHKIAQVTGLNIEYIKYILAILFLDAIVIIPFAWLRAMQKPLKYSFIKITNVAINLGLNIFFLVGLKKIAESFTFAENLYIPNFEINYILISQVISSVSSLILLGKFYTKLNFRFDKDLWKKMMKYAFPVLIAGIAYSINEAFDRLLLDYLLPKNIAETTIGMYAACYKIAVFMTLFVTGFKLGVEPFFFSQAEQKNKEKNYATILEIFVMLGALMFLGIVVFTDILKLYIIRSEAYRQALWIVPFITLANLCLGIYHNLSVWYKVTDKTKIGAYISILGAMVTLALNFWLIPIISYKGAAIATLAAYASMMLISYLLGKKYYPIPYNIKKIGLYLGLSSAFAFTYFFLFRENYYVGILFLLLLSGTMIALEKNQLISIYNSIKKQKTINNDH